MKFSVILPIYNVELYLAKCIDSILNQSYTDFELILVMMALKINLFQFVMNMQKKMRE